MDNTKYEIPEDLKAVWDVLPQNCWERQLIQRISELLSENKRLSAPVSDEEWTPAHERWGMQRGSLNRFLAARQSAKEPPTHG